MRYAALQNLANVVMAFIDKDMTFEYTHGGPVESPESEHIAGEVQILVDGEVLGGWVNPRTAHDWLLGVVWGVQHRAAG